MTSSRFAQLCFVYTRWEHTPVMVYENKDTKVHKMITSQRKPDHYLPLFSLTWINKLIQMCFLPARRLPVRVTFLFICILVMSVVFLSLHVHYTYTSRKHVVPRSSSQGQGQQGERINVLLMAYFRGGSTFLGSMFKANPDVFYFYEPLHALYRGFYRPGPRILHRLDGNSLPLSDANLDEVSYHIIKTIFQCELHSLWMEILGDMVVLDHGFDEYPVCLGDKPSETDILKCLPLIYEPCVKKQVTAIKTIKFKMRLAEEMLQKDQSLKIIHQVRDPRPSIFSQYRYGFFKEDELNAFSREHCSKMLDDVLVTARLQSIYPGRVKLIYYEDITVNTQKIVMDLYDFIGIRFTEDVEEHIKQLRSNDVECFKCLNKPFPEQQLTKWRETIQYTHAVVIDEICKDVNNLLGYIAFENELHLRNINISLRGESNLPTQTDWQNV